MFKKYIICEAIDATMIYCVISSIILLLIET